MEILVLSSSAESASFATLVSQLLQSQDTDSLVRILTIVRHLADHHGHPQPPYAKPLREVDDELCEIRTPFSKDTLLRIYYFVDRESKKMILLTYLLKPDGRKYASSYEGNAGKQLEKDIQSSIRQALSHKARYLTHLSDYEPLPL